MKRLLMVVVALVSFLAVPAFAQKNAPAGRKMDAQQTPVVHKVSFGVDPYIAVFTDYEACRVNVLDVNEVEVVAKAADSIEKVQIVRWTRKSDDVDVIFLGQSAGDPASGPDLINRKCASMIKAIPDTVIRNLAMKVIVE